MPSLIAYRKVIDSITTHTLRLPDAEGTGAQRTAGQEIATLADGRTIVKLDDGATLPEQQPAPIVDSIETLPKPLPEELRAEIRAASPHCRLIDAQMIEQIRSRYSVDDEMYLARIGVGTALGTYTPAPSELAALRDYQAWVEGVREWGRAQRSALGV